MKKAVVVFLLALAACSDTSEPLISCATWSTCTGALQVHTEIVADAFHRHDPMHYSAGDSLLVRTTLINHANIATDSFTVNVKGPARSFLLSSWPFVTLAPGKRLQHTDTMVLTGYTFGEKPEIEYAFLVPNGAALQPRLSGDRSIDMLPSGYTLDVVAGPPMEQFSYKGRTFNGRAIQTKDTSAFLVKIGNPYQATIVVPTLGICIYDDDYCMLQYFTPPSPDSIGPGESLHREFAFAVDPQGRRWDWWTKAVIWIGLCGERAFGGNQCVSMPGLMKANIEAECSVATALPGVTYTDAVPECGVRDDGSAWRFTARRGERYRVELLSGTAAVFISPAAGLREEEPRSAEITVPVDGTYYIIMQGTTPVSFRLTQL